MNPSWYIKCLLCLLCIECVSFTLDAFYFTYCRPTSLCIQSMLIRFFSSQSVYCKYMDYIHNILTNKALILIQGFNIYA